MALPITNREHTVETIRRDLADLSARMERLERILEGDAERGNAGLAFTVQNLHKDLGEVKNAMFLVTGTLNNLKLERAKIIGAALTLWSIGLFCGWIVTTFFQHSK